MDWDYEIVVVPICSSCLEEEDLEIFASISNFEPLQCAFCAESGASELVRIFEPKYWKKS